MGRFALVALLIAAVAGVVSYTYYYDDVSVLGFACGSADSNDYVDRVFSAQAPGFYAPLCADEVFGNFETAMVAGIVAAVSGFVGLFTGIVAVRR